MSSEEKPKKKEPLPYKPRMTPSPADSLNTKRTILISFSFLTVLLAWSFFNFKVPLLLDRILGANPFKDIIKGGVMAMDNLVAVIVQPFFGDLSDRTESKLGRRMPFIIVGTTSSAIFFIMIPWIQILAGLVLIIFLFDLAMSIFRSSSIAILPDYTSDKVYSKGSAIQQFIANMGGLVGFAIPLIIGFIPNLSVQWIDALGFLIVALLMLALLAIQLVFVKETPTGDKLIRFSNKPFEINSLTYEVKEVEDDLLDEEESSKSFQSYRSAIEIIKKNRDFAFFLGAVVFMYLAFAAVESFFSSFAMDYLGLFDAAFQQTGTKAEATQLAESQASTLFLAYSGPMIASAYFVGLVGQSQKFGRKAAVKFFLGWLVISVGIMSFLVIPFVYQNYQPILIIVMLVLISVPWMGFIVNSFPILWALAPKEKTGIYTGIYYTFNQAAYTLAPITFGGMLSVLSVLGDYRYIVMFPFIFGCIVIAFIFFSRIKGGEVSEEVINQMEQV